MDRGEGKRFQHSIFGLQLGFSVCISDAVLCWSWMQYSWTNVNCDSFYDIIYDFFVNQPTPLWDDSVEKVNIKIATFHGKQTLSCRELKIYSEWKQKVYNLYIKFLEWIGFD